MEPGAFGRIPFVVVAIVVAVIAFGLVALGLALRLGLYSLGLLAVPLAIVAVYMVQYSRRPYEPRFGGGAPDPSLEEQFDDPVEEADRIDREGTAPGSDAEGATTEAEPATELGTPPSSGPP